MNGTRRLGASVVAVIVTGLTVAATTGVHAWPATWARTGDMATPRRAHTLTLLPDGKVLAAGGVVDRDGPTAELYDPATGTWTVTSEMPVSTSSHTATLLENGKVLVAGGYGPTGPTAAAALYDPGTGTWTATGSMTVERDLHTATLLKDGRVLVAGGYDEVGVGEPSTQHTSAELYDPATGTWSATGSMTTARHAHSATLFADGAVLVSGGWLPTATAELYNPATGAWTTTGPMNEPRHRHDTVLLSDRHAMVVGGSDASDDGPVSSTEIYDALDGTWSPGGSLPADTAPAAAVRLPDGKIVAVGLGSAVSSSGLWTATDSPLIPRTSVEMVVLQNGKVLVAGGRGVEHDALASAELLDVAEETHAVGVTVTKTGSGRGKVTSTPAGVHCGKSCSAEFLHGTHVELKADPARGSRFVRWRGCPDAAGKVCTLTLVADETVKARFKRRR